MKIIFETFIGFLADYLQNIVKQLTFPEIING